MEEFVKAMSVCQSARRRMLLRTRTNRSIIIIQEVSTEKNQKTNMRKCLVSVIAIYNVGGKLGK
jgi:hypothetical protein